MCLSLFETLPSADLQTLAHVAIGIWMEIVESVVPNGHCFASLVIRSNICVRCMVYYIYVDRFQYIFEILSHLGVWIVVPKYLLYLIWSGNDEN